MAKTWDGIDRRSASKKHDLFYRLSRVGNILSWILFVSGLVVLHYARPERISGVQRYWGVTGREEWNAALLPWLYGLFSLCILFSIIMLLLRKYRSRRQNEKWASGLLFLIVIASAFVAWVYQAVA